MKENNSNKSFKSGRVAILGRPNAGKSTLLNALLEVAVSATSKRPQTTRSNIRGIIQLHEKGEWVGQLVLVDTPGINFKKGLLDRAMHMSVEEALREVDCVIWVADARTFSRDLTDIELGRPGSDKLAGWLQNRLAEEASEKKDRKWILALSKSDLVKKNALLPVMEKATRLLPSFSNIIPIAAELGFKNANSNLVGLLEVVKSSLPVGDALFPEESWTDLNDKQLIQNLIREAIFRQLREEIPYQCDSTILQYKDPEGKKKLTEVDATIWVAKDSLKPILVGARGSRIKEIGQATRDRYKEITGEDLVLRLFVKVVDNWDLRPQNLAELGYVLGR